jgi:hypothetical protein
LKGERCWDTEFDDWLARSREDLQEASLDAGMTLARQAILADQIQHTIQYLEQIHGTTGS